MTQFIQPNQKSDLKQDVVRDWISQAYTGIQSGFDVSNGTTDFNVNITSGVAWINKVRVDDDETRLDMSLLSTVGPAGTDEHWIIQMTHTPADTFPPPSAVINAKMAVPPAVPSLDADSVKLADIFVPVGANDITDCRIVKAPKLPDRGSNDGDVIVERLLNSNMNVMFGGGGSFVYDSGTNTLTWTQEISLVATTITNKEKFQSVPLAELTIPAGAVGPAEPAPNNLTVGDNSILFAVFDRISAASSSGRLRVLNLDAPDPTEANAFYDPVRERIVFIGGIFAGNIKLRSGFGDPVPASSLDPNSFLRNDPAGVHYWSPLYEDLVVPILSVSSFEVASTNPVEVGTNVVNPTFTVTVENDGGDGPDSATLTNDDNGESKNIQPDFGGMPTTGVGGSSSSFSYLKNATGSNSSVTFTVTADDGNTPATANAVLNWYRKTYYGSHETDPGDNNYDKTFLDTTIAVTGGNELVEDIAIEFSVTIDALNDQYIYFAYPAWKNDVNQITASVNGGPVVISTPSFTQVEEGDPSSQDIDTDTIPPVTEKYKVYRSNFLQAAGSTVDIVVS